MTDLPLDDDPEAFRAAAHRAVDWVADYLENIRRRRVLSDAKPGEIAARFAGSPSAGGRSYDELLAQFERDILPGVTHWNHPSFHAYFSITGSQAGIIAETLSSALNLNGMLWKTSPALTELEEVTLGWLRDALGLPTNLFGIINDTASINTFLALAAARESRAPHIREEGMTGRHLPQFRIYCSDQAHSSVDKAALALGFGMRGIVRIASDEHYRMRPDLLEAQMERDVAEGMLPVAVVATLGTTSTGSLDPLPRVAEIAARHGAWLHVDASYAGSAAISRRFRALWNGIEAADSLVVNPHKWLFTQFDLGVLYTKHPDVLRETFSLVPEYLKTSESDVTNFMDYGLQLGRRFRALKLWMVLEHYGTDKLARRIEDHCDYAVRLAEQLSARRSIEIVAGPNFSVLAFRRVIRDGKETDEKASDAATQRLLDALNDSGELFLSHSRLRDRLVIRVAIGNGATLWSDVTKIVARVDEALEKSEA